YTLTLGPHSFYWLALSAPATHPEHAAVAAAPRRVDLKRRAPTVIDPTLTLTIQRELPAFLARQSWFEGRGRGLRRAEIKDLVSISRDPKRRTLAIVELTYREGEVESWLLVLGVAAAEHAERIAQQTPEAIIVEAEGASGSWLVWEASADTDLGQALTEVIGGQRRRFAKAGVLVARRTSVYPLIAHGAQPSEGSQLARVEQRVNTVVLGERSVMKIFRRLGSGPNPELELGRALTEGARFASVPLVAGSIEYLPARGDPLTLALLRAYAPADGDLAAITAGSLRSIHADAGRTGAPDPRTTRDAFQQDLERCGLLAVRLAELHLALASIDEPPFRPEEYTKLGQRSLYQSLRSLAVTVLDALRARKRTLPPPTAALARAVQRREAELDRRLRWLLTATVQCVRIRVHGDLHLGHVLVAAGDLVFIDLEGERWRSTSERRLKRSSLRDLAALLASYDDIAYQAATEAEAAGAEEEVVQALTRRWTSEVRQRLLAGYLGALKGSRLVPQDPAIVRGLLDVLLVERALGEAWGALSNGTRDIDPPLRRLAELLRSRKVATRSARVD
ncbi:MAG: phosphotransferase, partial [Candidatus Limnocylindria bacterium]|nr:phosphotransferase [Candidatus Limnocylindria bacterium]